MGKFISPDDLQYQIWHPFYRVERIRTRYGEKVVVKMLSGDLLTLPQRYVAVTDDQIGQINESPLKQFRIVEKKKLSNGYYTYIYEFSDVNNN